MKPGKDKKTGDLVRLYKRIEVKLIIGDGKKQKLLRHKFVAPANRGYTAADIEATLDKVIDYLDKKFPNIEFKHVPLLPNVHNYIAIGTRGVVALPPIEVNRAVAPAADTLQNSQATEELPGDGEHVAESPAARLSDLRRVDEVGFPEQSVLREV